MRFRFAAVLALSACAGGSSSRAPSSPPVEARATPDPAPVTDAPPPQVVLERDEALAYGDPAPSGIYGTYRVLHRGAPLGESDLAAMSPLCETSCDPASYAVADGTAFDLDLVAPGSAEVALGTTVEVAADATLYLVTGHTGTLRVVVDGHVVATKVATDFDPDSAITELTIGVGRHTLVLAIARAPDLHPRLTTRFFDAVGTPGLGGGAFVLGALDDAAKRDLAARALHVREERVSGGGLVTLSVRASFDAGGVWAEVPLQMDDRVEIVERAGFESNEDIAPRGRVSHTVRVGARTFSFGAGIELDRLCAEAAESLASLPSVPEASKGPVAWRIAELTRMVTEREPDTRWRRTMASDAQRLARAIRGGRDPFAAPRGYVRMGFVSALDGSAQPYELFVPPGYNPSRAFPLVITLHGFSGNAGDYFRNTFGLARAYESGETLDGHGRHGTPPTEGPMIVAAPTGRGQAHYRYAGEEDVLEVIADLKARFHIDDSRVYVTGGSMGGTGAAYLPFRHPDLFAASAALAGYHDQRVREDTRQRELAPWEQHLRAERSDVDWAENALHLPMLLVRGTEDLPLAWTRSLVTRLTALHYTHEHREPELGHNVWTETYANGAIFDWFAPKRRPAAPRRVRFRTARERHHRAYWVDVVERDAPDVFASVDARVTDDAIRVTTEHVAAITLDPPEALARATIDLDGTTLPFASPLHARRERGVWVAYDGAPRTNVKRAGVSGPIRDVYDEPLVFVIGSSEETETIERLVATFFANPAGWQMHYPIVRDRDVTPEMFAEKTLVLVGTPRSNTLLARMASRLPIVVTDREIRIGDRRYEGGTIGTVFVAPNPDVPDHSLLVIAAPTAMGLLSATFLPDLLPDYAIFDRAIEPAWRHFAAGGSGATFREVGFFGMDWAAPSRAP